MLFVGKRPGAYLLGKRRESAANVIADVGVDLGEPPDDPFLQTEHVMRDKHLTVARRAGADADGRNGNTRGDHAAKLGGNHLDHHRVGPGVGDGLSVGENLARRCDVATLHLETAERARGLRSQSDVPHDRDTRANNGGSSLGDLLPTLQLDGIGAALLQEAARVLDRAAGVDVVGEEWQIGDDMGSRCAAADGFRVIDDVIKCDWDGRIVALDDHPQRITDQEDVDACLFREPGKGKIVD